MLILSEAITRQLVDAQAALQIIEEVGRAEAAGRVVMSDPPTQVLMLNEPRCRYRLKTVALPDFPVVGVRIIGYPLGAAGEKSSTRFVLLSDPASGKPLALIDDHWTYTLRTAASAVAGLRHLVPQRPLDVAVIGAGNLAGAVLLLLNEVRLLRRARITSRRVESRSAFAARWSASLGLPVECVDRIEAATEAADLLVTATDAGKRLVEPSAIRKGMTLCTLGQYELAPEIYGAADKLVVDSWEIAKSVADVKELVKAGIVSRERIHAELWELVTGAKRGRESASETIIYRTDGLVAQDVAINYVVYKSAIARGLGMQL